MYIYCHCSYERRGYIYIVIAHMRGEERVYVYCHCACERRGSMYIVIVYVRGEGICILSLCM